MCKIITSIRLHALYLSTHAQVLLNYDFVDFKFLLFSDIDSLQKFQNVSLTYSNVLLLTQH